MKAVKFGIHHKIPVFVKLRLLWKQSVTQPACVRLLKGTPTEINGNGLLKVSDKGLKYLSFLFL